ncbi:programmed cell death protein 2 [Umbelopsis sp. AD052]|nr:programmed cell death protein 2 [Umbelopsis sp. AD052]
MNGNTSKKNRNSSQMRNKALPVANQSPAHNPFMPSLDVIPALTRDKNAKSNRKPKVMLGMPDIPVDEHLDNDAYATKIGGAPIWLIDHQHPDSDIQICGSCQNPMYLIFQGYVPLENSIYHRVMYVWACNRRICIKKPGSIKALRAHLVDPEYLKQLQKKEAARIQKEEQLKAAQKRNAFVASPNGSPFQLGDLWSSSNQGKSSAGNPFAMPATPSKANPFQMPGSNDIEEAEEDEDEEEETEEEESKQSYSQAASAKRKPFDLNHHFAESLTIQEEDEEEEEEEMEDDDVDHDEDFVCQMKFPGHYLYISEEEIAETFDSLGLDMSKYQKYLDLQQQSEDAVDDSEDGISWAGETYEKQDVPRGFDKAFKKFTERVGAWPEQCVRYEFGGSPLLFSNSDQAAKSLIVSSSDGYGVYSNSQLPVCPHCGSKRTFEFQLMPHMLSLLSVTEHAMIEEQTLDKTGKDQWNVGMEFGTVMIFVCENDCNGSTSTDVEDQVTYFEEHVIAQFELD